MISEQIKALRTVGKLFRNDVYGKLLKDAADTIEELSAKLATANMERSTAFDIEAILKEQSLLTATANCISKLETA